MTIINAHPTQIVIAAFLTYGFGFWNYLTSMWMQIKHKECPFYFWHHCWYFGHDLTYAALFNMWWNQIGFWLFKVLNIGCMLFCVIELVSLYYAVKYEKNWNWGKYYNGRSVPMKNAWAHGIVGYVLGVALFATIRKIIGDPMIFVLMASTLVVFGLTLRFNTKERRYVRSGHKMLAIASIFQVAFCFMPPGIGLFTTVVPSLNQPAFYILGVVAMICTFDFVRLAFTLPKKEDFLANGGEIFYVEDWQKDDLTPAKA